MPRKFSLMTFTLIIAIFFLNITAYALGKTHRIYTGKLPAQMAIIDSDPVYSKLTTPQTAFQFVRDHIVLEIYAGILRGIEGTYTAGAGNSIDQALLLAYLLNKQAVDCRIVYAQLNETQIDKSVRLFESDYQARLGQLKQIPDPLKESLDRFEDHELRQEIKGLLNLRRKIHTRIESLVDQNLDVIRKMMPGFGHKQEQNLKTLKARIQTRAREHYWIRANINGKWIDLDPALKLDWGQKIAEPSKDYALNQIPDELFHHISITIEAVFQQNDSQKTKQVLKWITDSASLTNKPIFLLHPAEGDPAYALVTLDSLLAGKKGGLPYRPVLLLENKAFVGETLEMEGWSAESLFSFGQAGPKPEIVAEEIIIDLKGPEGYQKHIIRPIFDRAGPAERQKQGQWLLKNNVGLKVKTGADGKEVIDLSYEPQPLQSSYVFLIKTGSLLFEQAENPILSDNAFSAITNDPRPFIDQAQVLHHFHIFLEWMRLKLFNGAYAAYPALPNMTCLKIGVHETINPLAANEPAEASLAFDLLFNQWTMPDNGDLARSGLLDSVIEQVFLEHLYTNTPEIESPVLSAGIVISKIKKQNVAIMLIDKKDAPQMEKLPEDLKTVISPLLDQYALIIPEQGFKLDETALFAYYLVDKENENVVDSIQSFGSNALTEYIIKIEKALEKKQMACMIRRCLQGSLAVATNVLHVVRGRVSMKSADALKKEIKDVQAAFEKAKDCSGVVLHVKVFKQWAPGRSDASRRYKDIREKLTELEKSAKGGKLVVPKKSKYDTLRDKKPDEFAAKREKELNRKRKDDEDWDHRNDLRCGGTHSPGNVFPMNSSDNKSIGAVLSRSCSELCDGMTIKDIVFEYVLDHLPGAQWVPLETEEKYMVWINTEPGNPDDYDFRIASSCRDIDIFLKF